MMTSNIVASKALKVNDFINFNFNKVLHSKQRLSLSNAVIGALSSESLIPSQIGIGLSAAKGLLPKHSIKQVDRLISNNKIDVQATQSVLAESIISNRKQIIVAMDWTIFGKDLQMTITLRLVTNHGRATPLLWHTVNSVGLKGHKNNYVFMLLARLRSIIPDDTNVIVLADREFGTLNNMTKLTQRLKFDYILRIKRNFTVTDTSKQKKLLAYEWLNSEEAVSIDNCYITVKEYPVKKVVIAKEPGMKEMWCLVCSKSNISTKAVLKYYGKRWGTETSYRDEKDIQFGMGLKKSRIKCIERRNRIFLISAIAIIFLTMIGAASELVGFDKYLKPNTVKRRSHSLFTQGKIILKLLPSMSCYWRDSLQLELCKIIQAVKDISSEQYIWTLDKRVPQLLT